MIYKMIDPDAVREMCEALDSPAQLLSMYEEYTVRDLQSLGQAIQLNVYGDIEAYAHKLTGSFSFLGANAFIQLSRRLEQAAIERQDIETLKALFQRMKPLAEEVLDELRVCIEKIAGA